MEKNSHTMDHHEQAEKRTGTKMMETEGTTTTLTEGKMRKGQGYDEMESTEMVAAEFPTSRSNDYRKQGHEQPREQTRDPGREKGREQGREWQPKKIRSNGLPPMSIEQQLEAPFPNHMFYDDSGIRRLSHKLQDCRRFQLLAEATWKQQ